VVTAGDTVGELSIVDGGTRSADAETLEDTTVVFVPREVLLQLLRTEPSVAEHILRIMAATLRRLTEATADLVFLDLPRRVAKVLLEHPRTAHGTVDLGLTQSDLAHRVGATRQSVNASLRTLERRGWITVDGQTIVINQVEALSRYAVR
jgi:CRP-like cAMP-binding protein